MHDEVYRADVLAEAYARCRAKRGAAGIDGQNFADIEADNGLGAWLARLSEDLRKKTYQPQPVRRVWIPKADGKKRPLGIPTLRDRVVQMAPLLDSTLACPHSPICPSITSNGCSAGRSARS